VSAGICPQGHASDDPDWCDVCGLAMAAPVAPVAPPSGRSAAPDPTRCPACGADLDGRFCEVCGHDSAAPVLPTPAAGGPVAGPAGGPVEGPVGSVPARTWRAVVRADRAWFDEVRRQDGVDAATLQFPRYTQERRFVLSGAQVAIGRRSAARGVDPDVDLTGLDPAVSATHALLIARSDGGWELVDVGSTNGTTLAVEDGPIPAHRPVPLADGAVIRLGAWTTITITADP
jgi:hypothetical protein